MLFKVDGQLSDHQGKSWILKNINIKIKIIVFFMKTRSLKSITASFQNKKRPSYY